jgi:FixJ family two-component response regulator
MDDARPSAEHPLVVLVEDDEAVRAALKFTLEMEGFSVHPCRSAEDLSGLRLPDRHACLVVDERLPGQSGLAALLDLRRAGVTLPAALITTNPKPPLRAAAARAAVPILEKPLLGDALIGWLRGALAD